MRLRHLTFGLAFAGLSVGGTTAVSAQDKQDVIFWYEAAEPDQREVIENNLVQPFEQAHTDQNLVLDFRGNQLDQQLRVALLSGGGPDVVLSPGPSYIAPMVEAGQLMPLNSYMEEYHWNDKLLDFFVKLGTEDDGNVYAIAKTFESLTLFYNKTIFEEHGWEPPTNLEELETVAAAMMEEGIVPFGAGNGTWRPANEWYVSIILNHYAGPQAVAEALRGERSWTDPVFVEAINLLKEWYQNGWFGDDYFSLTTDQAVNEMAVGRAGMSPNGTWAFSTVRDYSEEADMEAGVVPFPSLREEVPYPVYALGIGTTMSINANASNPDGAAAVIDSMFSTDFYDAMSRDWPGEWNIPLADISSVDLEANVSPLYANTMKSLSEAVANESYGYTTWSFWPPASMQHVINGIEEVWLDRKTTEQYLAELDEVFQQELAEGKVPDIPER